MNIQYDETHFRQFECSQHKKQKAVGQPPAAWFDRFGLDELPHELPKNLLTREQVFELCCDPKVAVLKGYVCTMAWGGQGSQRGGKQHVKAAWAARSKIADILERIRSEQLTREQAYDLFCGEGAIPGLAPAFFTKLLYFFRPGKDCYIMDQWTSKSVNLLTGRPIVRLAGSPHRSNTGDAYRLFCEIVDDLADRLQTDGSDIEERLFSKGGRKKADWRAYVVKHWK
jgi:hypothetical protein